MSESDIADVADLVCDCRPSSQALRAVGEDARQLKLEYLTLLRGAMPAVEEFDADGEEDYNWEDDSAAGYDDGDWDDI